MDWLGQCLSLVLGWVWRFLRVLWVCRAATLSAVLGGLLIVALEQARDLFADTGLTTFEWSSFFFLLFVWAWLVHGMGRRALQFDEWVPEAHRQGGLSDADRRRLQDEFWFLATWTPRILGLFVFGATGWALWLTRNNLIPAAGLEQAEVAISLISKLLVATALTATVYLGFVSYWRALRARIAHRPTDAPLLIGAQSVLRLLFLALVNPKRNGPALLSIFNTRLNQTLMALGLLVTAAFVVALILPAALAELLPRAIFLPVLLGGGILLFGEIASLSHRYMTPLLVCFFILGGWFGYLLYHYNDVRWVAPPSGSAAAISIRGTQHQLGMSEAIERWRTDNDCRTSIPDCPRPIVIAGAGGASRAGFFTATVVGAMIDAGVEDPELGNIRSRIFALSTVSGSSVGAVMMRAAWMDALQSKSPDKPPCRETGTAVWFRGDAPPSPASVKAKPSWRDCFQKLMAGDFLSPVFVGLTYRDLFPLGNPLTGMGIGEDRSGLLEQSFERWYQQMTGGRSSACGKGDGSGLCRPLGHLPDRPDPTKPGDWIPLLFVNGTSVATGRRIIVSDVRIGCVMDGDPNHRFLEYSYDYRQLRDPGIRASVGCSDTPGDPEGKEIDMRLSTVALMSARFPVISTHGVIRDTDGNIVDSVVDGGYFENDGLATAADIVRELKSKGLHPIVIRIVNEPDPKLDQQPALKRADMADSASVYKAQQAKLPNPSNRILRDGEDELMFPPLPKAEERSLFDTYTSIGRALYATRSGHEDGHLDYLRGTLQGPLMRIGVDIVTPEQTQAASSTPAPMPVDSFCRSQVKTTTAMEFVSMSWWLSQPVQAYLDAQLCRPQIKRLVCVLKLKANESAC